MTTANNQSQLQPQSQPQPQLQAEGDYQHLSEEETKSIITPHAFSVNTSLFGLSLATPWQRGIAMLIDIALVAILAKQDIALLAIVAAAAFFKAGSLRQQPTTWRRTRKALRLLAVFIAMAIGYEAVDSLVDNISGKDDENKSQVVISDEISAAQLLSRGVKYIGHLAQLSDQLDDPQCIKTKCWRQTAEDISKTMAADGADEQTHDKVIGSFFDERRDDLGLSVEQTHQEVARLKAVYHAAVGGNGQHQEKAAELISESIPEPIAEPISESIAEKAPESDATNLTEWVKGIITDDLGFGFGWAAFYFTLFTAWWKGQTPGKRLMNIRVIQLDGSLLSLWDSFGRYGGYGAGFATGLLGFAQIYWDPNRQAIQDKISATVVIQGDME